MKSDGLTKAAIVIIILMILSGIIKIISNGRTDNYRRNYSYSYTTPTPRPTKKATVTPKTTHGSNKKSNSNNTDPYNAADFYDYEDFYYDHYDDFWEVDDAEQYWKNHQ